MLSFSVNRDHEDKLNNFILVYATDRETLTPDHAYNRFMKTLQDEGMLGIKEYKQHGADTIYDQEREDKYGHDKSIPSSEFLHSDKFNSYRPTEPVVDQYADFIDDIFTAHLIKDLLSDKVLGDIMVNQGFDMERCFKDPKLFNATPDSPRRDLFSKREYCTPDRKQVLIDTIRGLGYDLEDINLSKLCITIANIYKTEDDNYE